VDYQDEQLQIVFCDEAWEEKNIGEETKKPLKIRGFL
jgi:hypothetical protein